MSTATEELRTSSNARFNPSHQLRDLHESWANLTGNSNFTHGYSRSQQMRSRGKPRVPMSDSEPPPTQSFVFDWKPYLKSLWSLRLVASQESELGWASN
jgi:hypothetical protein